MADAVDNINTTTMKDVPAWAEAVRALGAVGDARAERLLLLRFAHAWIGTTLVAFTVAVSLLVLEVIHDFDDPIGGAWGISPEPYRRIVFS